MSTTENVYRYALSVTSQFYFCGIPFRFDTSPKCSFNCRYCFAMSRGGRKTATNLTADVSILERKLERLSESPSESADINGELLRLKMPIHFGGMSDPFSDAHTSQRTIEILQILNAYNYPVVLSTKNTTELQNDRTISLLKKFKNLVIQISIPIIDKSLSKKIEPNVPPPNERIESIRKLTKEGFYVIARCQPLIPGFEKPTANDLIPWLSEVGTKHVVVEYLKLPVERQLSLFSELSNIFGGKLFDLYEKLKMEKVGREWVLPNKYKWDNLQPIIAAIKKGEMTYGAADYGLNHLGDTDCCCGIDELEGFNNWFKGNIPYAIKYSTNEPLTIQELKTEYFPQKSIRMYLNSNCRENDLFSVEDYIRSKWNKPGTENAPNSFLGVVWNGDRDKDGNCVYFRISDY